MLRQISDKEFEKEIPREGISAEQEFSSANILGAKVKSTGMKGGDWGHGSRHYVSFKNEGSTGWYIRVKDESGNTHVFDDAEQIEILLGGDTELETFSDSLDFSAANLRKARSLPVPKE